MPDPHVSQPTPGLVECAEPDEDRLLLDLTAASLILERAHSELLSQAFIHRSHDAASLRLIAIDLETARAKLANCIARRATEL